MYWKAHLLLTNTYYTNDNMNKKTYGFKSKHHPGIIKQLETFEKELFDIASSLKSRNTTEGFQNQLKEDISSINSSPDVLIFADKTNNIKQHQNNTKTLKRQRNETYKNSSDFCEKVN